MIADGIRIEQLDRDQLWRLLELLSPPGERERPTERAPRPPALAVLRGGAIVRLARIGGGLIAPDAQLAGLAVESGGEQRALRELRHRFDLPFLVGLRSEALAGLVARIDAVVRPTDDLVAQALAGYRALQPALGRDVFIEPRPLPYVAAPPYELVQRTFDQLVPDGHTIALYVLDGARLWTSLLARKRHGSVDLVTTHQALATGRPVRSVRDARAIVDLVRRRYGPPHLAAFVTLDTWRRFVDGDRAAIARAMAAKQAVIEPCPAWLLALIGGGAVSEAASRSFKLAGRLLSPLASTPLARRAQQVAKSLAGPLEPLGQLDPQLLLGWGRTWSERLLPLWRGDHFGGEDDPFGGEDL